MNKLANALAFSALISLWLTNFTSYGVNLVGLNGQYLTHTNQGLLQFINPTTLTTFGSIFLTSDQGSGYQAEVTPTSKPSITTSGIFTKVGPKPQSLIECQQPFGNPIVCATSCGTHIPGAGTSYCTGTLNTYYASTTPDNSTPADLLNENGSKSPTSTNFIFLDTIVNNSNSAFEIATTTAPLIGVSGDIDPNTKKPVLDPNTIAGALEAGSLSTMNIYGKKPSGAITLGKVSYPVTFVTESSTITDNRYVIASATKHNPTTDTLAIKRHMADKNLTLDVLPSTSSPAPQGNQTIILFPNNMQSTCQPVIFIGRAKDSNEFYALTYLGAYNSTSGQQCCQNCASLCADQKTCCSSVLCTTDTLFPNSDPFNILPTATTNTDIDDPNYIKVGQPGRLAVDIECISGTGGYGYAVQLKSLPGTWYPGQPDFTSLPTKPTPCTS